MCILLFIIIINELNDEDDDDVNREMTGPITRLPQCHPTIVNIDASYESQQTPYLHHEISSRAGKIPVEFHDIQ